MDCLINELISVLNLEVLLYEDILKMSRDKTAVIIEGNVNELEKIMKSEQSMILEMSKVENQREILINKISKSMDQKPEELTLSFLIENCSRDQSEKLKDNQIGLGNILKELGSVNEMNSQLIRSSLDYINFSLNLFTSADNQDNNYGLEGEKSNTKAKSMLDIKI